MAKPLNFNNIKKRYLTVTLADEKKTTLMIGTPTKAVMNELILLQSNFESLEDGDANEETIDDLYITCAKVMSRNKGGIVVTKEYLEEVFDIEDIMIFFSAYMDFVGEIAEEKN